VPTINRSLERSSDGRQFPIRDSSSRSMGMLRHWKVTIKASYFKATTVSFKLVFKFVQLLHYGVVDKQGI
jgi:hypothetical protein